MGHNIDSDANDKKQILESIVLLNMFSVAAYTVGVEHELSSILKYYKAKLYDLRHINVD